MKKILGLLFVFVVMFLAVGCGEKSYTVEFLVDNSIVETQNVVEGKDAIAPKTPEKEGFLFKGWDKEFTNVKSDLKVNAIFEEIIVEVNKYTVEFLVDGKVVDTQIVEENNAAKKPADPVKEGFLFKGWDKEFTNVKSDLKVNAIFEEDKVYHTVTFTVEGATYATVKVEDGKAAELPEQPEPTLDGKYFAGWRKDTSCVTSDMTVQAKFVAVNLETKTVMGLSQIAKAPFTMYWKGSGIDSNSTYYNKHIYIAEGIVGNNWWYQIAINNVNGRNEVVEVSPRGQTAVTKVCDYSIVCYTDALASILSGTGVQVGDVIEFSKQPNSFTEITECDEFFRVKRAGEITQYLLDSDTAHTVVALHKIQKYFENLGEKISLEKIDLITVEEGDDGTNATNAKITWTSSNPEIIALDGTINLPDSETEVTLTAVATYETSTYKQVYKLKVGK